MFLMWVCKAKVRVYLIILSPFQRPLSSLMTLTWPCFFISFIPSSKSKCFPNVRWINRWFHEAMASQSKHPCNKQRHSRPQILLNLRYCLITAYYDCLGQDSQPGANLPPFQEDICQCLETAFLVTILRMLLSSSEQNSGTQIIILQCTPPNVDLHKPKYQPANRVHVENPTIKVRVSVWIVTLQTVSVLYNGLWFFLQGHMCVYPFPHLPSSIQAWRDLFDSFSICLINRLKALEGKYSIREVERRLFVMFLWLSWRGARTLWQLQKEFQKMWLKQTHLGTKE